MHATLFMVRWLREQILNWSRVDRQVSDASSIWMKATTFLTDQCLVSATNYKYFCLRRSGLFTLLGYEDLIISHTL